MASSFYGAIGLIGGAAGDLDAIDGAGLADQDGAFVVTASWGYRYILNAASGAAENSPWIISPDANPGTKRWLLRGDFSVQTQIQQAFVDGDATPDVSTGEKWITANTGATTITDFDNPDHNGSLLFIVAGDANTTIADNANIKLQGDSFGPMVVDDTIMLYYQGSHWVELARKMTS